jgi:hypothetical protein
VNAWYTTTHQQSEHSKDLYKLQILYNTHKSRYLQASFNSNKGVGDFFFRRPPTGARTLAWCGIGANTGGPQGQLMCGRGPTWWRPAEMGSTQGDLTGCWSVGEAQPDEGRQRWWQHRGPQGQLKRGRGPTWWRSAEMMTTQGVLRGSWSVGETQPDEGRQRWGQHRGSSGAAEAWEGPTWWWPAEMGLNRGPSGADEKWERPKGPTWWRSAEMGANTWGPQGLLMSRRGPTWWRPAELGPMQGVLRGCWSVGEAQPAVRQY